MMLNKNYNNANICILVRSGLDYDDSMIQIKRTTGMRLGWGEKCDSHAMKLYSLALSELNFIHRQIISRTKGCKKTNCFIEAEYFSPPLIPLKSFHWHIQTTISPDLLLTLNLFLWQVSLNSSLVSRTFLIKNACIFDPTANRNEQCI